MVVLYGIPISFFNFEKQYVQQKVKERSETAKCETVYKGYPSYIHMVRWDKFVSNIDWYINLAISIRDSINDYDVRKM